MPKECLKIEKLNFKYPNTQKNAVAEFSITVNEGEFVLVCGRTGSSKSTLLRLIKPSIAPHGEKSGKIEFYGTSVDDLDLKTQIDIGFVFQNPDLQIVTDKVYTELAFGLENLNINSSEIRNRVSEIADFFGLSDVINEDTANLSGGKKQLLALASIVVMRPRLLILDEPTSSLDPVAAEEFLSVLDKLNREFGITIIISEHRLQNIFPYADQVLILEEGTNVFYDCPRKICSVLKNRDYFFDYLPPVIKLYAKTSKTLEDGCPLTVREGKSYLMGLVESGDYTMQTHEIVDKDEGIKLTEYALELDNISFRYEKNLPDILSDFSLKIKKGEIFCLMGTNAVGKTTALKIASGILCPYEGKIKIFGKKIPLRHDNSLNFSSVVALPQDASLVFTHDTVSEDFGGCDLSGIPFDISHLMARNPTDLSGGEAQLCAIAKALCKKPQILLLDEPTRGIDPYIKKTLIRVLKELKSSGVTVFAVTHDTEFAAECADRCGRIFGGELLLSDTPTNFFSNNYFYTTSAQKLCRNILPNIITDTDMLKSLKKTERET